ncbi:MAG: hypothetical protein AB1938_04590 [Myxococcota bacterium]
MTSRHRVTPRAWLWLMPFLWMACSGGCGGCSCLQPIPGGYDGKKLDNAVAARVTQRGFDFISNNYAALLMEAGLSTPLSVPVPCSSVSFGSDGHLCDQNRNNACDNGEACTVTVDILSLNLAPANPTGPDQGILNATARLRINTGDMWMRTCAAEVFGACICRLTCSANFSSTRSGRQYDDLTAEVRFTIDARYGRVLAFDVPTVGGINSLEGGDLDVNTSGFCSALACSVLDIGFIRNFVMDQFIKPALIDQVRSAVDDARCRACGGSGDPACPGASTCQGGQCRDPMGCVPTTLGMEGRLDLSAVDLGGIALSGGMDVYAVAGGTVSSAANSHLTLGVLGGAEPFTGVTPNPDGGSTALRGPVPCVPAVAEPPDMSAPAPDWNASDAGYHVGVAVSSRFLKRASWAAHQAGAMCLDLSTAQVGLLTTGLFEAFLPSLGKLATVDGKDAPMLIALRPKEPPRLSVGKGTFDPVTKLPVDPLLRLEWTDLHIDVYAMLDERFFRLFSLTTDVNLPLSLVFSGCDQVTPAIGDVKQLLTNVRAADSEVLAEDPQVLADLIPSLLAVAESSLASGLGAQTLPSLGAFRLKVNEATGVTPVVGTPTFEHLGLFAELVTGACPMPRPQARAVLKGVDVAPPRELVATGVGVPWPTVRLDVSSPGSSEEMEWAFRVDDGLWSTFRPAAGELRVTHPALLLQGTHRVEVRTRPAKEPHAVSMPEVVEVTVDFQPPKLALRPDSVAGTLNVAARDLVTTQDKLRWYVQVGQGPKVAFTPTQVLDLATLDAAGGATVFVEDEAGHVAQERYVAPITVDHPDTEDPAAGAKSTGFGCSVGGGLEALALAALVFRRRRRGAR